MAPGSPPRLRTAPVHIYFMKSTPFAISSRHTFIISLGESTSLYSVPKEELPLVVGDSILPEVITLLPVIVPSAI